MSRKFGDYIGLTLLIGLLVLIFLDLHIDDHQSLTYSLTVILGIGIFSVSVEQMIKYVRRKKPHLGELISLLMSTTLIAIYASKHSWLLFLVLFLTLPFVGLLLRELIKKIRMNRRRYYPQWLPVVLMIPLCGIGAYFINDKQDVHLWILIVIAAIIIATAFPTKPRK